MHDCAHQCPSAGGEYAPSQKHSDVLGPMKLIEPSESVIKAFEGEPYYYVHMGYAYSCCTPSTTPLPILRSSRKPSMSASHLKPRTTSQLPCKYTRNMVSFISQQNTVLCISMISSLALASI